jgi:type IV pilus assembly protein PilY1
MLGIGLMLGTIAGVACAGTVPVSQEPQVLVILDTSQGMAGNLQGAIMSGSGTVTPNAASASPPCYSLNGYTPRSTLGPSNGGSCPSGEAPYTVSAGGVLTDNSESMINVAEQGVLSALNNPTYSNIMQAGLLSYATKGTPKPYNTWVYYMSSNTPTTSTPGAACTPGQFGYGSASSSTCAANDPLSVPNPCYNAPSGGNCKPIAGIIGSGLTTAPYLYISQTSDAPQINDVLYWSTSFPSGNFVTYSGPHPANPYSHYNLSGYEDQVLSGNYLLEGYNDTRPNIGNFATSPTDAGYIPYSGEVWYANRGLAFDGNPVTSGSSGQQGNLDIPVAPLNAAQIALFNKTMAPEQFVKGGSELVAGSEFAPTAGALTAALTDLTTSATAPQPACAPKYVILITNGQPTMGLHGHIYPPLGSAAGQGYGEVLSAGSANNDNAVTEAVTAVKNLANYTTGGLSGIKTYVLGVGAGVNCPPSATGCTTEASDSYSVLKDLAAAGKTNVVYSANTAAAFQQAFNAILNNIAAQIVTASGGSSSSVIGNSSYEYVATSNPSLGEGNLSAYLIKSSGNLASSPSWNINAEMTVGNRSQVLYSEGPATGSATVGPVTLLTSMDSAAFAIPSGSSLTPSIIEQYTINPSYDTGKYLGGRQSGWYVGLMTANKPTYMGPPNDPNLLGSTGYDSYAQGEAGRTPLVLAASNDGFLYAVNATSGSLVWGWMPRPLVQGLQGYSTFWQGPNMAGMRPRVVDAQAGGSSSAWATYVVGGAQQGAVQYALQLTSSGSLNSEAWEQDNADAVTPNAGVPVIFRLVPGSGTAYEAAVLNTTTTTTTSSLVMTNVATGTADTISLPFVAGSQPYIDDSNDVFIGDNAGNVWMGSLVSSSGKLAKSISWTPLNNSAPSPIGPNFGSSATTSGGVGAITYIDGAYYNGIEYLTLQSTGRLTVLQNGTNSWAPLWTSYAGGSDSFTSGGYVASTSVASLPANTIVTNPVQIVNGAVILPTSVPPSASTGTCALSTAEYYYYRLDNGGFPAGVFGSGGKGVAGPLKVGAGIAYTPSIAVMNGQLRLQGMGSGGVGPGMTTQGPPPAGPASWRELFY